MGIGSLSLQDKEKEEEKEPNSQEGIVLMKFDRKRDEPGLVIPKKDKDVEFLPEEHNEEYSKKLDYNSDGDDEMKPAGSGSTGFGTQSLGHWRGECSVSNAHDKAGDAASVGRYCTVCSLKWARRYWVEGSP